MSRLVDLRSFYHLSLQLSGTVTPLPKSATSLNAVNSKVEQGSSKAASTPAHQDVRVMIPLFGAAILILVLVVAFALYCRRKAERKRYENYAYSGKFYVHILFQY